jgi:hypothetical protein
VDADTRAFVLKVIGGGICIGVGLGALWNPPVFTIEPLMAGALLTAGLLSFGVNIGATVAAGREAAVARQARNSRPQ